MTITLAAFTWAVLMPARIVGIASAASDPPLIHNNEMLCQAHCLLHIVSHKHHGSRLRPEYFQQLLVNVRSGNGVYGREWFVQQKYFRAQHHGSTQADPLLLPATELVRIFRQLISLQVGKL
jgi:hypothetical protein